MLQGTTISVAEIFDFVKKNDINYESDSEYPVYFNPKPCSLVLNDGGTPKEVYHGTGEKFSVFLSEKRGLNTGAPSSKLATFFVDSKNVAEGYAMDARPQWINELYRKAERLENQAFYNGKYDEADKAWREYEEAELEYNGSGEVMPVYLDMKNPLVYDFKGSEYREESYKNLIQQAIKNKNDGVIFKNTYDGSNKAHDDLCTVYAVFNPNQIKSVDNGGTFSSWNDDIYYSKSRKPKNLDVAISKGVRYNENGLTISKAERQRVHKILREYWRRDSKDLDKYRKAIISHGNSLYFYIYKAFDYDSYNILLRAKVNETNEDIENAILEVFENDRTRVFENDDSRNQDRVHKISEIFRLWGSNSDRSTLHS